MDEVIEGGMIRDGRSAFFICGSLFIFGFSFGGRFGKMQGGFGVFAALFFYFCKVMKVVFADFVELKDYLGRVKDPLMAKFIRDEVDNNSLRQMMQCGDADFIPELYYETQDFNQLTDHQYTLKNR